MAYSLKLDPDGQYVELRLDGEFDLPEVVDARQQANSICRQYHIQNLLIDARQVQTHLTILELYTLASDLAGRESLPGMHYAVVVGQDSPRIDLFGQIARRRGVQIDHFTAYTDALCELVSGKST